MSSQGPAETVSQAELYGSYLALWEDLNANVDEEHRMVPANGDRPTYAELRQFYRIMRRPVQRKLLWIATGYIYPQFPDDEAQFQQEDADGMTNETNVTTMDESSDDEDAIPDLNDENAAPIRNANVYGNDNADSDGTLSPRDLPSPIVVAEPASLREASPLVIDEPASCHEVDDFDAVAPSSADQELIVEDAVESDNDSDLPSAQEIRDDLNRLRAEELLSSNVVEEDSDVDEYDSSFSVDGFVVDDEEDSVSCEEVSTSDDESNVYTPTPKKRIDREIYGNHRDVPKTASKAMKKNSPVTPKAAPKNGRQSPIFLRSSVASRPDPRRSIDRQSTSSSANQRASRRSLDRTSATKKPPASRRSLDRTSATKKSPASRRIRTRTYASPSKNKTPATRRSRDRSSIPNSSSSQPGPSNHTVPSVIPAGYEEIEEDRRRNFSDSNGQNIVILSTQNGKAYFRKFKFFDLGKIDESRTCLIYQCIQCHAKGKETWVKVQKHKNNTCYAEIKHHLKCELKEWNLD